MHGFVADAFFNIYEKNSQFLSNVKMSTKENNGLFFSASLYTVLPSVLSVF